jgi:hypothetical protein
MTREAALCDLTAEAEALAAPPYPQRQQTLDRRCNELRPGVVALLRTSPICHN